MAKLTNAVATYQTKAAGVQEQPEDVSSVIVNIDPASTPTYSLCGSRRIQNTLYEWITEDLDPVDTSVEVEGFVVSPASSTLTSRQSNVAQIMSRNAVTTTTQESVRLYGKNSQRAHQMAKKGKELKRDLDCALHLNQARNLGSDAVARQSGMLLSWITTNVNKEATGVNPTGNGTDTRTAGVLRAFTQDQINDVMQQCYKNGAEPTTLLMGPVTKQKISTFGGRAIAREQIASNQAGSNITIFASDFGNLRCVPTRNIRETVNNNGDNHREIDVFVVDPSYLKVATLRNFSTFRHAKTADADIDVLVWEGGLQVDTEKAHGLITDIDPNL